LQRELAQAHNNFSAKDNNLVSDNLRVGDHRNKNGSVIYDVN